MALGYRDPAPYHDAPTSRPSGRGWKLSDSEAIDYVHRRVDPRGASTHRRTFEESWMRNCAYYNGKQAFIQEGVSLRRPILPPHRVIYKADFISGTVSAAVAKVLSNRITFATPPKDGSRKARDASRVSARLFDFWREAVDWDWLQEIAWTWAAICGTGFQQLVWDPLAGPVDRFYTRDGRSKGHVQPESNEEAKTKELAGHYEDMPQGEIKVLDHNPFQVHWDWRARERGWADAAWGGTSYLVDIEELENYWGPEKTRGVKPVETDGQATYFDEMLAFMASGFVSPSASYIIPRDKRGQQTILTNILARPSAENGNMGRQIAIAGGQVLYNGPNPYRILESEVPGASLPFLKYDWQIRAGSFIGIGLVERLTSPQFQYNRARAVLTEHQNVYGHPAMFVAKGSDIPTGHMSIQPGVVHEYNARPGIKPVEIGPVPTLSKEVADNANRAMLEIQQIGSMSDPDMSKLPGNIRGAPALEMMIAEKNVVLQPTAKRVVRETVWAGKIMLAMAKKLYTGRRTLRYVGDDNRLRVMNFEASNVSTDLVVVGEPGYFHSAATERAKILEYVQVGVLNMADPADRVAVLKALSYGTADEAIEERLADEENQEREIEEMVNNADQYLGMLQMGQPPHMPTQPYDDDATHGRVLRRFLKSEEARNIHPLSRQLLLSHLQEHDMKVQLQLQQQLAMMQAQKGMPGEKGTPSQPSNRGQA